MSFGLIYLFHHAVSASFFVFSRCFPLHADRSTDVQCEKFIFYVDRFYVMNECCLFGGVEPTAVLLPGAGSDRRYYRLSSPGCDISVIRTEGSDVCENKAFTGLAEVFARHSVAVPHIYGISDDARTYWQEDLGDVSLFSLVRSTEFEELAGNALEGLARMQAVPRHEWEGHVFNPRFGYRQVMGDLNYFRYCLLRPCGIVCDEERLEDDLEAVARVVDSLPEEECGFMYRDFQSRNVMVNDGLPRFIDFQGGRFGPVLYDAVSFLWQAKAALPDDMRMRLLDRYITDYSNITGADGERLRSRLPLMLVIRTLQTLGAYGLRGLTQRRAHFLQSLPDGIANLRGLCDRGGLAEWPELERACRELCSRWLERPGLPCPAPGLRVTVFSFSYKKGYPDDFTGNGGGFMFDCRAMHNPGRYEEYKSLTGMDAPVIDFLEERGEVFDYLENVYGLVDKAVDRYVQRGFSSLQIGFGCTGGQHRSVYCAESTFRHLAAMFPGVAIYLIHREQGVVKEYIPTTDQKLSI